MTDTFKLIAFTLCGWAVSGAALAQAEWIESDFALTEGGKIVETTDKNASQMINGIYAAEPDKAAVMYYCNNGEVAALVSTDGYDFSDGMPKTRRTISRDVVMYADGEPVHESEWAYMTTDKLARPVDKTARAKLFNAVIKGELITLEGRSVGKVDIAMPPVDDVFRQFAKDCGLSS